MINFIVQYTCDVTVKNWHLSEFGYKIVYNTSLFGFKSIVTARFIFLETRIIGLHFAANGIDLSSFKFFWCAP